MVCFSEAAEMPIPELAQQWANCQEALHNWPATCLLVRGAVSGLGATPQKIHFLKSQVYPLLCQSSIVKVAICLVERKENEILISYGNQHKILLSYFNCEEKAKQWILDVEKTHKKMR